MIEVGNISKTISVKPSRPTVKNKKAVGRNYAGQNLQQRKQQRYQQFLQAGLNVFGTSGYRSATVRSLCKEAKLTDRYFYESFGSIENLLTCVYEHCMKNLKRTILTQIISVYRSYGAEAAIHTGVDTYFMLLEDAKIAHVCLVELEGISPKVTALYHSYMNDFARMLVTLGNKAFPHWSLGMDKEQQLILGISLVGAMRQTATNWLINDYQTDRKTLVLVTNKLILSLLTVKNS